MSAQDGSGKMSRKVIEFRPLWREIQRAIPLEGLVTEERDAVSGRSVSGEKSEGPERDPFVWFVCKMLLTFFTVIASTAAQTESFRPGDEGPAAKTILLVDDDARNIFALSSQDHGGQP